MNSLKKIVLFYKHSFMSDVKSNIAYPTTFWMAFISIPIWVIVQITFIETIYGQTDTFFDYSKQESYVLFGTFKIVQSLAYLLFYVRLADLSEKIRGTSDWSLDMMLLKPIDSQLFITTGKFWFGSLSSLGVGIAIVWYGLSSGSHVIDFRQAILYFATVLLATALLYILFLCIQTLSFWLGYIESSEWLWGSLQDFGKYPRELYTGSLGLIINIGVPITLMGSVPVEMLYGKTSLLTFVSYGGIVFFLFVASRSFWHFSLKNYSGSSM